MKKSSIQLGSYYFKKLLIDWKDGPKNPSDLENLEITYNVFVDDKKPEFYRLDFFFKQSSKDNFGGLNIDIKMEGFFNFPEGTPENEMQKLVRINGCSILYSTLRGHLSSITSSFPCGRVILPTIVIMDLVKEIEEKRNAKKNINSNDML